MEPTDGELRTLAMQRVRGRLGLAIHVAIYLIVNSGLFAIWAITGSGYPWFLWPMFGWGVGIASHVIAYFWGPGSAREEIAIARELRRLQTHTQ